MPGDRRFPILALPHPHFMGLAPLDVWARMLLVGVRGRGGWGRSGGAWKRVHLRFWLRLVWCGFTSALATALTLPERAVLGVYLNGRASSRERRERLNRPFIGPDGDPVPQRVAPSDAGVEVLCVLGYYRSGTTHLHYILSCDPANITPRWHQVLAPQGWVLSWTFLRWFLVPFLGSTRPQDDVAIGPEWPAEDDFALCNWTLSSAMPGRMVLPREWDYWKRLNAMEGVTERERRRWRRAVWAFAWKVARAGGAGRGSRRRVILKTPSHTARVRELLEVFGPERVRFIHIARDPGAVLRSNIAMHRRFGPYLLQEAASDEEVRRRTVEEYDATERAFIEQLHEVPAGRLARIRYQDLVADPMGELRRLYSELGMEWGDDLERRFGAYLRSVADYRAASGKSASGAKTDGAAPETLPEELAWMTSAFGHDEPTLSTRPLPTDPSPVTASSGAPVPAAARGAFIDTLTLMLLWSAAWIGVAWIFRDRLDWMTWPTGAVLGIAALRLAGRGSVKLGLWTAALTLGALAVSAYPATCLAFYRERTPMPFRDVWHSTRDGLMAVNNLIWLFLGLMTAYRFGSRKHARAPGAG